MGNKKDLKQTLDELAITKNGKLIHPIIETHCHLDYLKKQETKDLIKESNELGIEKIVTICVSPENIDSVKVLAESYDNVFTTQGIHPHEAKKTNEEVFKKIEKGLDHPKVLAVGEIGLDYHYDFSPRDIQIKAFETQLEMACKKDLPVVIHTREADDDTIAIIKNFGPRLKNKGVFHSYTSQKKLAEVALDLGFYIGFNGIISFKKAQEVRDILEMTPVENIVLETDAPYLTPSPHRGIENSPMYLPFVAQTIIDVKSLDALSFLKTAYDNSHQLFASKKGFQA